MGLFGPSRSDLLKVQTTLFDRILALEQKLEQNVNNLKQRCYDLETIPNRNLTIKDEVES